MRVYKFRVMKKLSAAAVFLAGTLAAQNISSSRWSDLFSYNNVIAIRQDGDRLIAATENGIFYYTPKTGEITKLSKANGLHEVKITAFDYNPETKTGLVGYAQGSMDVITPEGITYIVDIPIAQGYNGRKTVNHISITGNRAVVSVDYGVSVFNLDRKEFGDSSFFVSNGLYEPSKEAVIKDNTVFAVTANGLKKHDINVTFPIYGEWQTVAAGSFSNIDVENGLIAYSGANEVWYGDGVNFSALPQGFSNVRDVAVTPKSIVVADQNAVYAFSNGSITENFTTKDLLNTGWHADQLYAGSYYSGMLDGQSISYKPDGPYANRAYKLQLEDKKIWVSTGARRDRYNGGDPDFERNLGFYFFNGSEWVYPSFFKTNATSVSPVIFNILDAVPNPKDDTDVFTANYNNRPGQGFYRFKYIPAKKDFDLVQVYPTGQPDIANRPAGLTYDDQNNLFGVVAFYTTDGAATVNTAYGYYDRGADRFSYRKTAIIASAQKPMFYEGYLWIPAPRTKQLLVVDLNKTPQNISDDVHYIIDGSNNLPPNSNGVISIAMDEYGDAWIGTDKGLRILSNAATEVRNKPQTRPILITENGIGEELFRDAEILQIEVDGGNRKWVSVAGGGLFYLSPDGQETMLRFTKENSPLPSNSVTDIKVDRSTGKVYFATFDGIVVYNSDIAEVDNNFKNVLVYPNPVVTAQYKGNVHIRGLAEKTNIRITDAAGNVVHQAIARGGTYEWDLTNKGRRVASGIYFVLMTNQDGTDTATAKIAVVN